MKIATRLLVILAMLLLLLVLAVPAFAIGNPGFNCALNPGYGKGEPSHPCNFRS